MGNFSGFAGVEMLEERCLMAAAAGVAVAVALAGTNDSYYVSPSGSTLNNGTESNPWPSVAFALTKVGGGHTILLEPGNYGLIWIPAGYGGSAASPTVIRSQYQWQAVIDGQGTDSGFGVQDGAQYVVVDGLQIRNCLGPGIKMNGSHNVISNNWVSHSGSGIVIYSGSYNLIQGNLTEYNGSSYWDGRGMIVGGDHETILGNVMRHNSSIGIFADSVTSTVISGNLIYDQDARSGIFVNAVGASAHNSVTNNTLLDNHWAFENGLAGVETYSGNIVVSGLSTAALDSINSGQVSDYSQVNPAWFTPDTVAPTASLVSSAVNFMDQYITITVRYKDNVGIDTSTLGDGDLLLSGPNGYKQAAVLKSWTQDANGILAVYNVRSPGAIWDAQDNGAYTLSVQSGQVADDGGPANYVAAGTVGKVTVGLTNRDIYVSTTGLATNNGTQSSPLPSVAYALSLVGGGHTIILEPGTYSPILVPRGFGGTSAYPTVIRSQYKWQAVVDGSLSPTVEGVCSETNGTSGTTDYVTFDGLKVVNAGTIGIHLGGDWNVAVNCWVSCSKASGIGAFDRNYTTIQNNLIEHNGTSTQFDHGIYAYGKGVVVTGNIVRQNSGCGIQLLQGQSLAPSTISGNLVYNNLINIFVEGDTGNDRITNNILLATTNNPLLLSSIDEIRSYGANPIAVWSGNRVESAISGSSLDAITSNIVADYSKALSLILPALTTTVDRTAPTAKVTDSGLYAGCQTVTVTYSDNQALNPAQINQSNVVIKGPGGYSAAASSVAMIRMTDNSRTVTVMYYLTAPKGGWTSANSGKYTVSMQSRQISDSTGNYIASGVMSGGFSITIANAAQSASKTTVAANTGTVAATATSGTTSTGVQTTVSSIKVATVITEPVAVLPPVTPANTVSSKILSTREPIAATAAFFSLLSALPALPLSMMPLR